MGSSAQSRNLQEWLDSYFHTGASGAQSVRLLLPGYFIFFMLVPKGVGIVNELIYDLFLPICKVTSLLIIVAKYEHHLKS